MSDLHEVIKATSTNAGQSDAMLAVVYAICEALEPESPLALRVHHLLEETYAKKLQTVTNQAYFDGFERAMELLRAALQEQPAGSSGA